jgi:hypothetical protein
MTTNIDKKLKGLLDSHTPETVLLASWLEKNGISYDLQQYYLRSGWLESLGVGAFKRPNENVRWEGAMHSLQLQAQLPVHVGGMTSLSLQGMAHYVRMSSETIYIYSPLYTKLPKWFLTQDWGNPLKHVKTSSLPQDLALFDSKEMNMSIRMSSPERAILECLHLAPDQLDLVECYHVLENLPNLRPKLLQELLEHCTSIKIKRLFLFLAEKAKHQWLSFLDQSKISIGNGERSIVKGGSFDSKYKITVPKELVES